MSLDGARRAEILETAATLFASSGFRTSLHEIANASGILPGSLYHHFESKEAIIIELVQRYRDDLDRVAKESLDALHEPDPRSIEDRIVALGEAIAACAIRHRAALILSLYEPPTVAGEELAQLARQMPTAIDAAMLEILEAGRSAGVIRSGIDLTLLAERLCESMLHFGVGVFHRSPGAERVPAEKCRTLLHGVAVRPPAKTALDRSDAMRSARAAIAEWDSHDGDDRIAQLRSVARSELGRRGYEATTMRDIAAAAGLSTGTVYRIFGSKDELLVSIMQRYLDHVSSAWDAVLGSSSSTIEQLDALLWVNINARDRFSDEFRVQLAWLRQSPPTSVDLGFSFGKQLRQLKQLLTAGTRAGEIRLEGSSADTKALSMFELIEMPETIVRASGTRGAHALGRDTVLRGAATRS